MPQAAPRPCRQPGCSTLVTGPIGYCDPHRKESWAAQNKVRRSTFEGHARQAFYWSPRWRAFRRIYLASHPLCVMCESSGRVASATEIDHVVPVSRGGETWDDGNLQALCKPCHSSKTLAESVPRPLNEGPGRGGKKSGAFVDQSPPPRLGSVTSKRPKDGHNGGH